MNVAAYFLAPVLIVYTLIMAALVMYILNMTYLAVMGLIRGRRLKDYQPAVFDELPFVTVQLPIALRGGTFAASLCRSGLSARVIGDSSIGRLDR